ncbi:hypothetical protein DRP53_01255 [candidate division WOR-3 bacterium]|uniref:Uncharacterized protein n=1 Tax=candidate division WOR-3 bacterium TaxID=2052148 RepID=A0A660SNG3_UNCW3|nr:MAG: hypothetical protein DRP53_01255 [candidate division WOR-3 bacterium]
MILLLFGILDTLLIPDPFQFEPELTILPGIVTPRQNMGADLKLGDPIGIKIDYYSLYADFNLGYERGEDWIRYESRQAEGKVILPITTTIAEIGGGYHRSARLDSPSSFFSQVTITTGTKVILQGEGGVSYHQVGTRRIRGYSISQKVLLPKVSLIPHFRIGLKKTAFGELKGFWFGLIPSPFLLRLGYAGTKPAFQVGFTPAVFGLNLRFQRGMIPTPFTYLYSHPPIRFSDSIKTGFLSYGVAGRLKIGPITVRFDIQEWDSLPVPGPDNFRGRMDPVCYHSGSLSLPFPTDSLTFFFRRSDIRYGPRWVVGSSLLIWNLGGDISYLRYPSGSVVSPTIFFRFRRLKLGLSYSSPLAEIYPGYRLKQRITFLLSGRISPQ